MMQFIVPHSIKPNTSYQPKSREHRMLSDWIGIPSDNITSSLLRHPRRSQHPYCRSDAHFNKLFMGPLEELIMGTYSNNRTKNNKNGQRRNIWKKTIHVEIQDFDGVTAKVVDDHLVINIQTDKDDDEYTEVKKVIKLPSGIEVSKLRMFVDGDDVVKIEAPYKTSPNNDEQQHSNAQEAKSGCSDRTTTSSEEVTMQQEYKKQECGCNDESHPSGEQNRSDIDIEHMKVQS